MNEGVIIITKPMKACADKHKITHHKKKKLNETMKRMGLKLCSTGWIKRIIFSLDNFLKALSN